MRLRGNLPRMNTRSPDTPEMPLPASHDSRPQCWVVSEGAAGTENQCLGLAEALGFTPIVKRIQVRAPWRWLSPDLWPNAIAALSGEGDSMAPPWPRVLIASGKKAAAPAMAVRKMSGGRTFTIQVQDPRVSPVNFDLVVAPQHDGVVGGNVIQTVGALTRVTKSRLDAARESFAPMVADLPQPRVAVLVGGRSRGYDLTPAVARQLGLDLAEVCARHGAGLMVTTSRRTPPDAAAELRSVLKYQPAIVWEAGRSAGENPYFGFLALAEHIVVTADSVSMASEAASTGKPVYIAAMKGSRAKFQRFHEQLQDLGIARTFDGTLGDWRYKPLDETSRVASLVAKALRAREAADTAESGGLDL